MSTILAPLSRLEGHAVLRQRWFVAAVLLAVAMVGFFYVLATRESDVLGFTGYGRVMAGVVQASLIFVPLLALLATAQAVPSARDSGVLEWYMTLPVDRPAAFRALWWPRLVAVAGPAALATLCLGGVALVTGRAVEPQLWASLLALLSGQAFCFAALGMMIGAYSRSSESALVRALLLWAACALLVDFIVLGLLLRWDLSPFAVFATASLNPMQAGRVGILASIDPEMGALGPVGTWAVVTLGAPLTTLWGLGWPFLVGVLALALGRWRFLRGDVL
ncbi:MAG: ABC transporter permease subunit [Deltaproteobacteria bacterium]|nr:ABC transporter permease subunit [Deltaproteobacteria bacterium]